jgi:hypothetical protein
MGQALACAMLIMPWLETVVLSKALLIPWPSCVLLGALTLVHATGLIDDKNIYLESIVTLLPIIVAYAIYCLVAAIILSRRLNKVEATPAGESPRWETRGVDGRARHPPPLRGLRVLAPFEVFF